MSVQSEIERISYNINDSLAAVAELGVEVPVGANSNDLAALIRAIPRASIVQTTGQSESDIMSQKAVTDAIAASSSTLITDATTE